MIPNSRFGQCLPLNLLRALRQAQPVELKFRPKTKNGGCFEAACFKATAEVEQC
jgi:hypothetical protein